MKPNVAALMVEGALRGYLTPRLAQDAGLDLRPLVAGITARNWQTQKPHLQTSLLAATTGKLAADADLADVAEMLDQLDDVANELAATAEQDPNTPPAPVPDKKDPDPMDPDAAHARDGDDDMVERVKAFCEGKLDDNDIATLIEMMKPEADTGDDPAAADATATAAPVAAKPAAAASPARAANTAPPVKPLTKAAMDSAIAGAVKAERDRLAAIREAEREVRPYVGDLAIAQDSATAVYRVALDSLGIDHAGVTEIAGLRLALRCQPKPGAAPLLPAMDAAVSDELAKRFPAALTLKKR